jgi:hypothetical protein
MPNVQKEEIHSLHVKIVAQDGGSSAYNRMNCAGRSLTPAGTNRAGQKIMAR